MGQLHPVLEQARTADGKRRFYAPGEHPALARAQCQLARMDELGFGRGELADEIRRRIAVFEQGQTDDKLAYLMKVESR